jgi:phosphate transport system ATP-binding protein
MAYASDRERTKFDIQHFSLYYGDFKALKEVSMQIDTRQITALIGPSGCGKSTFLKSLNRMNDIEGNVKTEGQIYLTDKEIYTEMDAILLRKKVGMVFQQPNAFPKSVYENVAYGPKINGIKKKSELDEIVEKSLKQAAVWDEVKDRLHKSALGLSGGQQQRVCIARTLAVDPEVILMDEPTSALDPISTLKIEELALALKSQYTIVIVTHNMQQASRISDKTAFFLLGEVIEYNKTETIFSMPKNHKTEAYITGRFG